MDQTSDLKLHVTSALFHVDILYSQKFKLIITNDKCIISPKKVWSSNDSEPFPIVRPITGGEDMFVGNVSLEH
jgi:hypothetical protein